MVPILFIVLDGLGDRPLKYLDWKTPLEAAKKPNFDRLARKAITGLIHTIDRGVRPGSDVAHLALFGYDPKFYYSGRGPFEAAGYGADLQPGDIAFRGNLATINDQFMITDRRAGRIDSSAPFADLINGLEIDGVKIMVKPGLDHRLAVVLRGKDLSDKVSDTDPHLTGQSPKRAVATVGTDEAKFTASVVNKLIEKARILFNNHPLNKTRVKKGLPPANYLLLRGGGKMVKYQSFQERYDLKAACIAGAGLYKGVAKLLGMEIILVEGVTGKPDTNVEAKINRGLGLFTSYDFVFIHIKATDSLAEDGNGLGKKQFIEKIDKSLKKVIPLVEKKELILMISGDHTTASDLKIHTADEVPLLIAGFGVRTDRVKSFGERPCQNGGLGHIKGMDLMDFLINLRGQTSLYGN